MVRNNGPPCGMDVYFSWKQRHKIGPTLEHGVLAPHWDDVAAALLERGYTWYTVRRTIELAKPFAAYAESLGLDSASQFTEELVERHIGVRPRLESRRCLSLLLSALRARGVLDPLSPPRLDASRDSAVLDEYVRYLIDHRGIGATVDTHRRHVREFLETLGVQPASMTITSLEAADVFRFITARAGKLSRSGRKAMCAAIRSFLRYLHVSGHIPQNLASAVPVIPNFKLDRVPKALGSEDIRKIIGAVNRSTAVGRRDYAVLLVLATYGMRSCQLCTIHLEDVDWRRETLRIRGAKGGRDVVLPLLSSVGEAIVDYLEHARPQWPFRQLFLRVRAPMGPLKPYLSNIIRIYAQKAQVTARPIGACAWRHGCATRLLAQGQSIKTIRDILGHRSIETTFIYTKVDVERLREAALDWPEVVS